MSSTSKSSLVITSLNCRNVKSSVAEIQKLCDHSDILLLQETWLLECDLPLLSTIHQDFYAKGISSVDLSQDVLRGRPHGGLAILWRKCIGHICKVINMHDSRLMGIEIANTQANIFVVNVYLPYCDKSNIDDYLFYLAKMDAIISECETPLVYFIGDFNADIKHENDTNVKHNFGKELLAFCQTEGLLISDKLCCSRDTYTYFSESHGTTAWLDHVVCTRSAHDLVTNVSVLYDNITSDHHPMQVCIDFAASVVSNNDEECSHDAKVIKWDDVSVDQCSQYTNQTDLYLSNVELNHDLLLCSDPLCNNAYHISAILRLYNDIIDALLSSSRDLSKNTKHYKHVIGWNEYCKTAHTHAREAYVSWRNNGKPRHGMTYTNMKQTRAYFKMVLRKCKKDEATAKADSLANKLLERDDKAFWREMKKINNSSLPIASMVNGVSGVKNVTDMWKVYFESLLNSSTCEKYKSQVDNIVNSADCNMFNYERCMPSDIQIAIKDIKIGKACGIDGIYGEHLSMPVIKYMFYYLCYLMQ